ncbi:uncharacterized protein LOC102080509 isoform X2 [Oreochromis niloticus]|uniref:uncharacterized protein LOC102080509 isoform X2 n=1 Tax=Oreochromis niloticus TaxID=8128 RepID=UPI0009055DCF|nr:uncharacterized protein LOC102080509 isoform X2 [Oreochromis niloticus]
MFLINIMYVDMVIHVLFNFILKPSASLNQEGETSVSDLSFELPTSSESMEIIIDVDADTDIDIITPESSYSDAADPDVPSLKRTDSIFLTSEYLQSISKVADTPEASGSCIESTDDEYIPSKDSGNESSSEGFDSPAKRVPLLKIKKTKKSQKTSRRKTLPSTSSEEMQEDVESDLSETDASKESSFSSSTSRSQRSRSQPTTDEFDEAPTGSSTPKRRKETGSDIDDPKEGTSHTHRTPCFASGTSTKEKESDTDATKMGPPRFKQGQWTTDEPDGDHTTAGTSKKRTWTSAEVQAVEKTLMSFIESGKVPGKSDCVACIEASPKALKNRTWTAVKFYVKNRITAMQRKAAKRV